LDGVRVFLHRVVHFCTSCGLNLNQIKAPVA
jgi:hypothetical protein